MQSYSPMLLLGLPSSIGLEHMEIAETAIVLSLSLKTSQAACPLCQQESLRVHSRYVRTLQDIPCIGKSLRLLVQVRRFFCETPHCSRKIFAERLPELTEEYADGRRVQQRPSLRLDLLWEARLDLQ